MWHPDALIHSAGFAKKKKKKKLNRAAIVFHKQEIFLRVLLFFRVPPTPPPSLHPLIKTERFLPLLLGAAANGSGWTTTSWSKHFRSKQAAAQRLNVWKWHRCREIDSTNTSAAARLTWPPGVRGRGVKVRIFLEMWNEGSQVGRWFAAGVYSRWLLCFLVCFLLKRKQ